MMGRIDNQMQLLILDLDSMIPENHLLRQILMRNKGEISDDRKSKMRGKTFHFAFLKFRKILIDVSL